MKVTLFLLSLLVVVAPAIADDTFDWNAIDRIGLYDKNNDRQINRNIWNNHSQASAINILNNLPNKLTSPSYRELAKRLLLSESPKSNDRIDSPALLAKRLDILIAYGFLTEATELYQKAKNVSGAHDNFELSLIEVQLALANGALAPACLDIQASSGVFRDMTAWRELSDFCRLRFGNAGKIKLKDLKFEKTPELKYILENNSISIDTPQSNLGILIAFSDSLISEKNYNQKARDVSSMPDLAIKMATHKKHSKNEAYQCYVIEGAKRGLINTRGLSDLYKQMIIDINNDSDTGQVTLHPCNVPAYFYQKLNHGDIGNQDNLLNTMIRTTMDVPVVAILPFAQHITKAVKLDNDVLWRSNVIMALAGIPLSDQPNAIMPFIQLQKHESINKNNYTDWIKNHENSQHLDLRNIDHAILHYISQTLSEKKPNFDDFPNKYKYGNLFSLTYARKSLSLGLGFNDYIARTYRNDNHAMVITQILGAAGNHDFDVIAPNDITVILSGLKAYKLEKKAVALAYEYLQ